jgi:hypothetical protein
MELQEWQDMEKKYGYHPEGPFANPDWSLEGMVERFGATGAMERWDRHLRILFQGPSNSDYDAYIHSDEWKHLANIAKDAAGRRCRVCNSPSQLNAHHRTYERFGHEDIEDLTVLCHECHDLFTKNGKLKR